MVKPDFFHSPVFLSLTVGVPFCIFKILFGILTIRIGLLQEIDIQVLAGFFIIIWAAIDLLMNMTRALFDLTGQNYIPEFCTLAELGSVFHASAVFLAIDTLITFIIICSVLWSGWIVFLTKGESYLWYFATTLNLISLSLVTLWTELMRHRDQKSKENGKL
jgi:hypothetical protein